MKNPSSEGKTCSFDELAAQAKGSHAMRLIVAQCEADEKGLSTLHHLLKINDVPMNITVEDFVSEKEKTC